MRVNEKFIFMHTRDCLAEMARESNTPLKCNNCKALMEENQKLLTTVSNLKKRVRALEDDGSESALMPVPTPISQKKPKTFEEYKEEERPEGSKCQLPTQFCPSANIAYSGITVYFGADPIYTICKPSHAKSQVESRFLKKRLLELWNEHGKEDVCRKNKPCTSSVCKNVCSGFVKTKPSSSRYGLTQYFCGCGCIVDYYSAITVGTWKALIKKHKKEGADDNSDGES